MKLDKWVKTDPRMDRRVFLISELGRRQDCLLRAPNPDLDALERLADEYDAVGLNEIAAELASRLEWLRVATF